MAAKCACTHVGLCIPLCCVSVSVHFAIDTILQAMRVMDLLDGVIFVRIIGEALIPILGSSVILREGTGSGGVWLLLASIEVLIFLLSSVNADLNQSLSLSRLRLRGGRGGS